MTSHEFQRLGVGTDGSTSMRETVELAQHAEALGFHSFWLAEGYHSRSAVVRASMIAAATKRIKIGLGILSPHTKHPALLAMDAATLDEIARDRVILGIGRVLNALRKHAIDTKGTIQVVKESIDIIRGLIRGEQFQYDGGRFKVAPPGSRLDLDTRGELPVYIAATGPEMLALAGQYADGILFNYPCTPGFIRYAMPIIEKGLARAGRTLADFDVAAYLLVSVDENERHALDAAKRFVAQKLPTRHSDMLAHASVTAAETATVRDSVERLGLVKAAAAIDDDLVRKVAIAGTPGQVVHGLTRFLGTGLKLPIAWEIIGPDRRRSLDLLARKVMPKFA
jgi:5,10-methylenetetrahydromethanopterin reductase